MQHFREHLDPFPTLADIGDWLQGPSQPIVEGIVEQENFIGCQTNLLKLPTKLAKCGRIEAPANQGTQVRSAEVDGKRPPGMKR